MNPEQHQPRNTPNASSALWNRSPIWRGAVFIAGIATATGAIGLLLNQSEQTQSAVHQPAVSVAPEPPKAAPMSPMAEVTRLPSPDVGTAPKTNDHNNNAPLPNAASDPPNKAPAAVAQAANLTTAEEEEAQARCHPHLLTGPINVPQIDVRQSKDPSFEHLKIHFWVNGAGLVVREQLTTPTVGLAAEQDAELAYTRALTFTVPDTPSCKSRQMELIGDFVEMRGATGQWATYAKLYPRLIFDGDGTVRRRE